MSIFVDDLKHVLDQAAKQVYNINKGNGWYDSARSVLEGHMLLVTEVAEASEAWRQWGLQDATASNTDLTNFYGEAIQTTLAKPEGLGSEYADIFIRLLDQCDRDGVDLAFEFTRKCEYNKTRGHKHGGKKL